MVRKRYYKPDNTDGVTPSRLKRLGRAAQLDHMETWFREYYEDPVNETPRSDGEYHYVLGGPYDAYDELWKEFGGVVADDRIQELAEKLQIECVEWAPTALKQQELGAPDEALAAMWPSEPRATSKSGVDKSGASTEEEADANDELTTQYVPPEALELSVRGTAMSAGSAPFIFERAPEPNADSLATEQRPAAYRFTVRDDGKIDVLPAAPEPQDRGVAIDLYDELVRKARDLHQRLDGTNVAPRVRASISRLLTALGTRFDDLRPALLLSHELSIAADRSAFNEELPTDIIAMLDDLLHTLMYLMAGFPEIRPIEAARAALYLDRNPDAIPAVREHLTAIKAAARQAGVATEAAVSALGYNDAAIETAADPVERTGLLGHSLLICRNFVAAAVEAITRYGRNTGTEVGELAGDTWREIKNQFPKGAGEAARAAPIIAMVAFAGWCLGPVTGLASAVTQFKPLVQMLRRFARDEKAQKQPKRGKDR